MFIDLKPSSMEMSTKSIRFSARASGINARETVIMRYLMFVQKLFKKNVIFVSIYVMVKVFSATVQF